tara:strand:+ start:79 stop:288 length:210 start_codon:yes stop_codon:yes gene_type:complete
MNVPAGLAPVLIVVLLVAVVIVLFTGLLTMAIGGRFTPEFRNKLMRTRVIIQGLIFIVVVITFAVALFS